MYHDMWHNVGAQRGGNACLQAGLDNKHMNKCGILSDFVMEKTQGIMSEMFEEMIFELVPVC